MVANSTSTLRIGCVLLIALRLLLSGPDDAVLKSPCLADGVAAETVTVRELDARPADPVKNFPVTAPVIVYLEPEHDVVLSRTRLDGLGPRR